MLLKEVRYAVIDPDAIVELEQIMPFIFEHQVLDLFAHAEKLPGIPVAESLEQIGLHHHHYPCQASMGIDPLYGDTLMHVSGNIMKDALKEALGEYLEEGYIRPQGYVDEE